MVGYVAVSLFIIFMIMLVAFAVVSVRPGVPDDLDLERNRIERFKGHLK